MKFSKIFSPKNYLRAKSNPAFLLVEWVNTELVYLIFHSDNDSTKTYKIRTPVFLYYPQYL